MMVDPDKTLKRKANVKAIQAYYKNEIKRENCYVCKSIERFAVMHHEDYEKPLEIIWLCHQCHRTLHYRRGDSKPLNHVGYRNLFTIQMLISTQKGAKA